MGRDDAQALVAQVKQVYVAKGRKQLHFAIDEAPPDQEELLELMLGRTGNLRAPTIRQGEILLVGFNEPMYQSFFGQG